MDDLYRHKPTLVRARQLTTPAEFETALGDKMTGRPGDWLIQREDGEQYVCPKGTFEACYEPVTDPDAVL